MSIYCPWILAPLGPQLNPTGLISFLWLKCREGMPILMKFLETTAWIHTQCLLWDESSLAVTYLLTWKLRAKVKLVCSKNPGRKFRHWNQMYIKLFFKRYLEWLVGSKCCLVAVQNIATICAAEEAMTLITHNPHRGNLVACQVSLNWLWRQARGRWG